MFLSGLDSDSDKDVPKVCLDWHDTEQQKQVQIVKKNDNYKKNLGIGGASYGDHEIDMNQFTIEKYQQEQQQIPSSESLDNMPNQFQVVDIPESVGSLDLLEMPILSEQVSQQQPCQRDPLIQSTNEIQEVKEEEDAIKSPKIEVCDFQTIQDLIPIPPHCPYSEKITTLDLPDYLKTFLISPLQQEGMFQCFIVRDKSGLNRFTPKYKLYWSHNQRFLMAAKKALNKSKFIVTQDADFKQKEEVLLLGKLEQSSQSKADYNIFDDGAKKKDATVFKKQRSQLGSVHFDASNDGKTRPRRIAVVLRKSEKEILQFVSRKPQLVTRNNKSLYTLDFFGRVKMPSVKNFQLVLKNDQKDVIYVQFGKVTKEMYNLDFMSPLSPQVAFSIALANFNFKGKA